MQYMYIESGAKRTFLWNTYTLKVITKDCMQYIDMRRRGQITYLWSTFKIISKVLLCAVDGY